MHRTLLIALASLSFFGPVMADTVTYNEYGDAVIYRGTSQDIRNAVICNLDGGPAAKNPSLFMAIKPVRGHCRHAMMMPEDYRAWVTGAPTGIEVNSAWPASLGRYGSIVGIKCGMDTSASDSFSCDWPPYGTTKP